MTRFPSRAVRDTNGGSGMSRGVAWAVLLIGCCEHAVLAQSPEPTRPVAPCQATCCPRDLLSGCPDDYCRKPWPWIPCLSPCGLGDDYCHKPWPRIWRQCGGEPDDYCRKPCPPACRPICSDHYTCGQGCCPPRSIAVDRTSTGPVWQRGSVPAMFQDGGAPPPSPGQAPPHLPLSPYHPQKENP